MNTVVLVILPIFSLILLGFICGRTNRLGDQGASELNKLVVWLCLPALLFKTTATAVFADIWHPGFIISFGAGAVAVFGGTVLWKLSQGKKLVEGSIDALSASYANTGYIGIPLCLLILGQEGMQPALISTLIIVCFIFGIALTLIEIGLQSDSTFYGAAKSVGKALLKNPLLITPIIGSLWGWSGSGIPTPITSVLDLLIAAMTPCALISLGLFLSKKHASDEKGAWPLVLIKLFVQPFVTWVLAFKVFVLPSMWAHSAVLLSAMPTGTGPFMIAEFYRREAAVIAKVILITTLGSIFTLSACVYWIGQSASLPH